MGTREGTHRIARALPLAVVVAALTLAAAAFAVAGDFGEPATSPEPVGPAPFSVTDGTFDADANPDLVTANFGASDVTILLGDGTGDFDEPMTSPEPAGGAPSDVAVANLNGDANVDLAVTNADDDTVSVLLGDGTGNFNGGVTEMVEDRPHSVAAANLDGDTDIDLAVTNVDPPRGLTILTNDGAGDFTASAPIPFLTENPREVVAADLNGGTGIDLAVALRESDQVAILLNNGSGAFTAPMSSPESVAGGPVSVAAANVDGDADVDLAVASEDGGAHVLQNNGSADFSEPMSSPEGTGTAPRAIVADDLNGDPNVDLAVANTGSDDVTILFGNGAGDFSTPASSPEEAEVDPWALTAADFDGEGSTDLAVANEALASSNVTILLNDFSPPAPPPPGGGGGTVTPAPAATPATPAPTCKKPKKKKKKKRSAAAAKKKKKKKKC